MHLVPHNFIGIAERMLLSSAIYAILFLLFGGVSAKSCNLGGSVTLTWNFPETDWIELTVHYPGKKWLGGEVVKQPSFMVVSPAHSVYILQGPNANGIGRYTLDNYAASAINVDNTPRPLEHVVGFEMLDSLTSFTYNRSLESTGASGDPVIQLNGTNYFMVAYGADWGVPHEYKRFLSVNWKSSTCVDASTERPYFYDGIPIYLGFLLPCVAALFFLNPTVRNSTSIGKLLFRTRVGSPIAGIPSWFNLMTVNFIPTLMETTWGGIFFFIGYSALYWTVVVVHKKEEMDADVGQYEAWGYAIGAGSTLNFALLTLPVTKNSIWLKLTGVSWERALKYHRVLARIAIVLAAAHFIIMYDVWGNDTIFDSENVLNGIHPIYGPVAFFIALFVMCLAADPVRRACYELFKYSHYAAYVVIIMIILHVDGYIYYQIPFIVLYGTDLAIRWYRSVQQHKVTSVKYIEGATNIQVELPRKHDMGDYYFVYIPEISNLEWHPFSAASGNDKLSFFIKDMGTGTFSGKLAEKAKANEKISIRLDGPYGKLSLDVFNYHTVVMISGGIGVTPMASTAFLLKEKLKSGENMGSLRRIIFVWIVPNHHKLEWMGDLFEGWPSEGAFQSSSDASDDRPSLELRSDRKVGMLSGYIEFRPSLYVTHPTFENPTNFHGIEVLKDKPNFDDIFSSIVKEDMGNENNVCALVCGPKEMAQAVASVTHAMKIDTHTESFEI